MQFADLIIESRLELKGMGIDETMISKRPSLFEQIERRTRSQPYIQRYCYETNVKTNLTWVEAMKSLCKLHYVKKLNLSRVN